MAKFVVTKSRPKDLKKGEYVVETPNFLSEIKQNMKNAGRGGLTGINHLRSIVGTIGNTYDQQLTAYTVTPYAYEGLPYSSDEELSRIVCKMLREQYPQIFDKCIDKKIKDRPFGTKLIYFVGSFLETAPFNANGIDHIEEKEIDAYMGNKKTKTASSEE